jgi:hypothetical protein
MITIARLRIRNLRAVTNFDLRIPMRGRFLIDAAAGMGKTSIVLGLRLALTGAAPGLAVGEIVRSGSDSALIELELSDGRDRLRLRRAFSRTDRSASARVSRGLSEIRADGPDQVEALLTEFFAYPLNQISDFFLWNSPDDIQQTALAADRGYLLRTASRLTGDSDLVKAVAAARGAVKRSHDSKRHRELVARRLRLLREWAGQALAVTAPALAAAREEADSVRAELARLQRQLTEVETLGKLGGRSGQIYAAAGQIIEQSHTLDRACGRLRLLHDMATEPDGGESELIKLRARASRLRSAQESLVEAISLESRGAGQVVDPGESTGAMLSRLVELRDGNAVPESTRRAYARWCRISEQINVETPAGIASRFALGGAGAEDPVRLKAELRILEREMASQGIDVPATPEQARQLASGEDGESIAGLEDLLRTPAATDDAESGGDPGGATARAAELRDRATTMLFGLDLPLDLAQIERSLTAAESEIARLDHMANDPPVLIAHTQELESEIARIRALLEKGREQLLQLAPEEGFEDFGLDLDRVVALRKSVLESGSEGDAVEIPSNPVLERRLSHARQRAARLDEKVAALESDARQAAAVLDAELEPALVEAREREPDEARKRQLESELEGVEGELGRLDDSLQAITEGESGPLEEVDIRQAELNLVRLQQRQRIRTKLAATLRGMDATLADRVSKRTLQNARNLLPQLSGGQFFDLRVAGGDSIELWNESARSWIGAAQCGSAVHEQASLLLWLARALTHGAPGMVGIPGFCVLDDPGALTTERLRQLLADTLVRDPMLDSIPQVLVLSERSAFAEAGFSRLHSLDPN